MNYTISKELDIRYEALCVLERMASGVGEASGLYSDCDAYCDHYLTTFALPEPDAAYIKAVREACRHIGQHHAVSAGDLKKYFKIIPETDLSLAGLLMITDRDFSGRSPEEAERVAAALAGLEVFPDNQGAVDRPKSVAALSEYLASAPFPDETKWACIDFCLNYDAHLKRAISLLDDAAALLAEKAELLYAMAESCVQSLAALRDSGGLDAALRGMGLTLDAAECEITPCAMRFSAISLYSTEMDEGERVHMRYGALVDTLTRLAREQRSTGDEMLRYIRAMADRNRVQILMKLKEAPQYGQDIITLTGLTAATVSHHMSELASVGLVSLEKQGTRILYRLCPDKVERLISLLETLTG